MNLEVRTRDQLLRDYAGPSEIARKMRNLIWSIIGDGMAPVLTLDFVNNFAQVFDLTGQKSYSGPVTGLLTTIRATQASYWNDAGELSWAEPDVLRFDHDPATGEPLGALIERGSTNLLLSSDELETQTVTVTEASHTLSFWGTGTVTLSGASTDGPLEGTGVGDRVSLTFTPSAGPLTLTVMGDVKWAQLETHPVATSYIKTEGSQVTRAADNISIPLSAFPWNEAEMTAVMEFETFGIQAGAPPHHILTRDGTGRFLAQDATHFGIAIYDGINFCNLGAISVGDRIKAAASFGPRGLRGCRSGGNIVSTPFDGTFGTEPNLYLGSLNGSNGHYLHFRKLKLFPRQLSDDELRAATA